MARLKLEEMEYFYKSAISFNNELEAMKYNNMMYRELFKRYKISKEEKRRKFFGTMNTLLEFSLKLRESYLRGSTA